MSAVRQIKNIFLREKQHDSVKSVKKDDLVTILPSATYYNGSRIPPWVFERNWHIKKIKKDKAFLDRDSKNLYGVYASVNIKYLHKYEAPESGTGMK